MRASISIALFSAAAMTACSGTLPLTGRMEKSPETFNGSISGSGSRGGSGALTLISSSKATCSGSFVNTSRHRGEGVLNCDDGRSGVFRITGTGTLGNGYGELSGNHFTFTFQDPP